MVGEAIKGKVNVRTGFCLLKFFTTPQVLEQFIHLSALYFDGLSRGSRRRPSAGITAWSAVVGT